MANTQSVDENISQVLNSFESVSLQELAKVSLLNRVDTKFMLHRRYLPELLLKIEPHYQALSIGNKRIFNYETQYFDTSTFQLYQDHHNGKANRLKVRYRRYVDSGLMFFEAKYRVKDARTNKVRWPITAWSDKLDEKQLAALHEVNDLANKLEAVMWNDFQRITLADYSDKERVTIDTSITFRNRNNHLSVADLAVVEVKSEKISALSEIVKQLRLEHLDATPFSKYSIGIAMMEKVKYNAFKPIISKLNKIIDGNN